MWKDNIPVPYDEDKIQNKFWEGEEWDKNLPPKGFITDFVLATRGMETPTIFSAWSALYLISCMAKRDAWLKWYPNKFFGNLYIVFVAPPRVCAKSTALRFGEEKVLLNAYKYLPKEHELRKRIKIIHSKATSESLREWLKPEHRTVKVGKKDFKTLFFGSEIAFFISELATFLGKQQYNVGLVDKLTDLFDCKDSDDDSTVKEGSVKYKNLYVCLCGGTTEDGLKMSIPQEALHGGFISRLILLVQLKPTRCYPFPMRVKEGPSEEELAKRLAWIALNSKGEYVFSESAKKCYVEWYKDFKRELGERAKDEFDKTRYDIHLIKTAMLVRMQRYERGNVITEDDFEAARKLLLSTVNKSEKIMGDSSDAIYSKIYNAAEQQLKKNTEISYRKLMQNVSPSKKGGTPYTLKRVIKDMANDGLLSVTYQDKVISRPKCIGGEVYSLIEN